MLRLNLAKPKKSPAFSGRTISDRAWDLRVRINARHSRLKFAAEAAAAAKHEQELHEQGEIYE